MWRGSGVYSIFDFHFTDSVASSVRKVKLQFVEEELLQKTHTVQTEEQQNKTCLQVDKLSH